MIESIYLEVLSDVPGNEHYKNRLIRILCGLIEVAPEKKQRGFHSHHIVPYSWKPEYDKISENRDYANKDRYEHNGRKGAGKIYCLDIMENTLTCVSKDVYHNNKDRYFHSNTKTYKEWSCKISKI